MGCWEEYFFNIGRDLATDCFENCLCGVRVIYQLGGILL